MSIADELMEYATTDFYVGSPIQLKLRLIANHIDAAHEEALGKMAERYVELPKDADGEYIHIGDEMENNERVARIVLTDDSWEPSVYLEKLPNVLHEYFCNEISHYHKPPTVEDVLCEMLDKVDDDRAGQAEVIAEYAKRLRLAGDAE